MIDVDAMIDRDVETNKAVLAYGERFTDVPVTWGLDDCSMFAAQWAADRLGREFVFPSYEGEDEGRALIASYGGLVPVWDAVAEANGLSRVHGPVRAGDIGVIHTFAHGDVGCIFMKYGTMVMIRATTGVRLIGIREKHVAGAWRVE
ncbi:DUF6950 family protein [Zhengella sp. ZM62]|uniref:DUF6950 family protein n=1 Tax=Zhengella sedimenti TaxID=3390035 RepID=UPI00397539C2